MLFLVQDGITNGAIYALLGLALVLVFAVTRVILIPQGEFVTYGALTYASLSAGQVPGTARLAVAMGIVAFCLDLFAGRRALHRAAGRARVRGQHRAALGDLRADALVRRPPRARSRVNIALSLLIVGGDRTVSLSHRVSADRAHLGAGAADRLGRLPSGAAGFWPGVLRRRGPARPDGFGRGLHRRPAALHRPEPRGLCPDDRVHHRSLAVLRLHALRQGAARHRGQSPRRAAGRHPHHAVGTDRVPAGLA